MIISSFTEKLVSKLVKHPHNDVYYFKQTYKYTCYVCGCWAKDIEASQYDTGISDSHTEYLSDTYYIIPFWHDNCRETFKLCPPLE